MGLFGFIGEVVSASVKVAVSPIAIASDVIGSVSDGETESTARLVKGIDQNIEGAFDELLGEEDRG